MSLIEIISEGKMRLTDGNGDSIEMPLSAICHAADVIRERYGCKRIGVDQSAEIDKLKSQIKMFMDLDPGHKYIDERLLKAQEQLENDDA